MSNASTENNDENDETLITTAPPGIVTFPPPHPALPPPSLISTDLVPASNSTSLQSNRYRRRLNRSNSTGGTRITNSNLAKHSKEFYTRQCVFSALQTQLCKSELSQALSKLEMTQEYIDGLQKDIQSTFDKLEQIVSSETKLLKKNSDLKSEIIILKAKNVYLQKKHKNLLNQLNFQERKMEETTLLFQTFQGVLKDRDKELKEIQEKKRCTVCLNNPSNIVFMKCKHCCICGDCHRTMVENDNMKCPICRESFILNECICIYFS